MVCASEAKAVQHIAYLLSELVDPFFSQEWAFNVNDFMGSDTEHRPVIHAAVEFNHSAICIGIAPRMGERLERNLDLAPWHSMAPCVFALQG